MAIRQTIYDIDLSKQLIRVFSGNLLAKNDKLANRMGANVFQDGNAVSLSGYTVKGYFIRNGVETLILDGTVDGNTAYVDLDGRCYHKDGSYTLSVVLCKDSKEQTLVIFDGRIAETITDTIVENENTLSLADLTQQEWVQNVLDAADTAMEQADKAAASAQQAQAMLDSVNGKAPAIYEDASGAMVQITDGAKMPVQRLACVMQPVQAGSGDAALDNVRPISGWGSVGAAVTGQNLFDGGDKTVTSGVWRYYLPVPLPAGTYTISAFVTSADTDSNVCAAVLIDEKGTNMVYANLERDVYNAKTVTIPRPCHSIRFMASSSNSSSTGDTATWSNIQIVPGDTAKDFEPYSGNTITSELPETVYGGYADIVNGTGEKTMGFHELTGDENISLSANETLGAGVTIKGILPAIGNVDGLCSHAVTTPYLNTKNAMTIGRSNASWIYWTGILNTLGLSTVEEFKAWLTAQKAAGTPVQIVYQIAQPVPFKVEAQPISTQKGVNNIWSSTGGTEATYAADTKLYIDKKLAAIAAAQLNA